MSKRPTPKPAATRRPAGPSFPKRLRARLTELGLTQAQFASKAGITPTAAWRYVHGHTVPTTYALRKRIAIALNVPPDWLD